MGLEYVHVFFICRFAEAHSSLLSVTVKNTVAKSNLRQKVFILFSHPGQCLRDVREEFKAMTVLVCFVLL